MVCVEVVLTHREGRFSVQDGEFTLPGLAQDLAVENEGLRRCGEEARNRGRAARRCIERVLGFGLVAGGHSTVVRVWGHMGVKGELGLWPPPGF